jgi:8-oxo-dGTP diphosphatase
MDHPHDGAAAAGFAVTVDLMVLTIRHGQLCVLVVKRGEEPYLGRWALPGAAVVRGLSRRPERFEEAAARELREQTGLSLKRAPYFVQLGAYGNPGRDPRGDYVAVAYLAVAVGTAKVHAGGDAVAVGWLPVDRILRGSELAFDHSRIVEDGVERVRDLIQHTALATAFCGPRFSIANLRRAYEIIWGRTADDFLDAGNFQKRVQGMPTLLREAGSQERPVGYRELGLDARPRPMGFRSRAGDLAGASTDVPAVGGAADDDVLPPGGRDQASSEPFAGSAPRGGPRPALYQPGPLILTGGYAAPLERPILDHQKSASPPGLSPKRKRLPKPS